MPLDHFKFIWFPLYATKRRRRKRGGKWGEAKSKTPFSSSRYLSLEDVKVPSCSLSDFFTKKTYLVA